MKEASGKYGYRQVGRGVCVWFCNYNQTGHCFVSTGVFEGHCFSICSIAV